MTNKSGEFMKGDVYRTPDSVDTIFNKINPVIDCTFYIKITTKGNKIHPLTCSLLSCFLNA